MSKLLRSYPPLRLQRYVAIHLIQQQLRIFILKDKRAMLLPNEALHDRLVEEQRQGLSIAIHIQQATRFLMEAQLSPRKHLHELLQRPVTSG